MNANLPPILARALAPLAPPQSIVHQIVTADERRALASAIDKANHRYWERVEGEVSRAHLEEVQLRHMGVIS